MVTSIETPGIQVCIKVEITYGIQLESPVIPGYKLECIKAFDGSIQLLRHMKWHDNSWASLTVVTVPHAIIDAINKYYLPDAVDAVSFDVYYREL